MGAVMLAIVVGGWLALASADVCRHPVMVDSELCRVAGVAPWAR